MLSARNILSDAYKEGVSDTCLEIKSIIGSNSMVDSPMTVCEILEYIENELSNCNK